MDYSYLLILLSFCLVQVESDNFAVIVAGSNAWFNYRHQADASHAYQVLVNEGHFPEENVVVMMYDDVANNPQNKFPGKIYNHIDGQNVYPGSEHIDYTGDSCTAETFLRVLNGTASGKVLKSGPEDNVFIYYVDHGAVGLVGMPVGPPLYAKDLLAAFEQMHDNKQYKEMVVYIEACESGSMLEDLDPTLNIFGTTAAMNNESSWACYFDEVVGVYLGDEYSVSWLEDSDAVFADAVGESLKTQFTDVATNVNKSSPQQYGDMSMSAEDIRNFQNKEKSSRNQPIPAFVAQMKHLFSKFTRTSSFVAVDTSEKNADSKLIQVSDSRDVKRNTLLNKLTLATSSNEYVRLTEEMYAEELSRAQFDLIFTHIASHYTQTATELHSLLHNHQYDQVNYDCLEQTYTEFEVKCTPWTDYGLKFVKTIVNICDMHDKYSTELKTTTLKNVIQSACHAYL